MTNFFQFVEKNQKCLESEQCVFDWIDKYENLSTKLSSKSGVLAVSIFKFNIFFQKLTLKHPLF